MADDLVQALAHSELTVAYQPKILCASGGLSGLVVLARWQHPVYGLVGPNASFPWAKEPAWWTA